jgi:hypothetical protein
MELRTIQTNPAFLPPPQDHPEKHSDCTNRRNLLKVRRPLRCLLSRWGRAGSTIPSSRVLLYFYTVYIDIIMDIPYNRLCIGSYWISLSFSLSTYCMYAFGTRERIKLMRTYENNIARPFNTRYWTLSLKVQLPSFEHPDPTNLIELSSQEGSIAHHPGISAIDSQIIVCREMCHIQTLAFD